MNTQSWQDAQFDTERRRLQPRLRAWSGWLHRMGLEPVAGALLDALVPIAPLGAQLLYVAQPVLSLLSSQQAIHALANVLDEPGGAEWLRRELKLEAVPDDPPLGGP